MTNTHTLTKRLINWTENSITERIQIGSLGFWTDELKGLIRFGLFDEQRPSGMWPMCDGGRVQGLWNELRKVEADD